MSTNPDQLRSLATISSLAISLQKQNLSDIQMDLLEVAVHLMTNIAVQSTLRGREGLSPAEPAAPLDFVLGEPVDVEIKETRVSHAYWQRTTIVDKLTDEKGVSVYRTARTKDAWMEDSRLRKVKQ